MGSPKKRATMEPMGSGELPGSGFEALGFRVQGLGFRGLGV